WTGSLGLLFALILHSPGSGTRRRRDPVDRQPASPGTGGQASAAATGVLGSNPGRCQRVYGALHCGGRGPVKVQQQIEAKLRAALTPQVLRVENESHRHNVPAGAESHFKVTLVADRFAPLS